MLLHIPLISFFCSSALALSIPKSAAQDSLSTPSVALKEDKPVKVALERVLSAINDFYIDVDMFPDHGDYNLDKWEAQTSNVADSFTHATKVLLWARPNMNDDLREHVVDYVSNYIYHDFAAAIDEFGPHKESFDGIGIGSDMALGVLDQWEAETKLFHKAVLAAVSHKVDPELGKTAQEVKEAFEKANKDYKSVISHVHKSKAPVDDALQAVMKSINNFYVDVFNFPEHAQYDDEKWAVQTFSITKSLVEAAHVLREHSPDNKEGRAHIVDQVSNYLNYDFVAAINEIAERKDAFAKVDISPDDVLFTMHEWERKNADFFKAVLDVVADEADDELIKSSQEVEDAIYKVYDAYQSGLFHSAVTKFGVAIMNIKSIFAL